MLLQVVQMKKYQKEQEDIKHIKEFIASCGESRYPHGGLHACSLAVGLQEDH